MKKIKFTLLVLIIFLNLNLKAQNKAVSFIDETNKNPIVGLQIFSENGEFLGNTNTSGIFAFDPNLMKQSSIERISINNTEYNFIEYKIDEIPQTIYLKKNEPIQLTEVVVSVRKHLDFYTINGYFRCRQLYNGKLLKYADGMVMYHMPNAQVENNFVSGVKSYITAYRTFTIDSLSLKYKKEINQSFEPYLSISKIPKLDIIESDGNLVVKNIRDQTADLYRGGFKFGSVVYDENKNPSIINTSSNPDEYLKTGVTFRNFKIKYVHNQKWVGKGIKRRPTYELIDVKSKVKNKDEYIETVVEIFLDEEILYDDKKPLVYKSSVNENKSFYNIPFWVEELKKHSLPSAISAQLTKINENKNTY
jgi:hypothetical protein